MYPLQTLTPGTPVANNDQDAPAPDDEPLVAGKDAPLIGGRTATHGRVATKGGDEQAGVERERVNPSEPQPRAPCCPSAFHTGRPRRTTRPGTRKLVDDHRTTWDGIRRTAPRGLGNRSKLHCAKDWMSVSRPRSAAFVAGTMRGPSANAPARRRPPARRGRARRVAAHGHGKTRLDERSLVSRPVRLHRRHVAPLIGARAATRGRSATEGGDGYGGVQSGHPFEGQPAD